MRRWSTDSHSSSVQVWPKPIRIFESTAETAIKAWVCHVVLLQVTVRFPVKLCTLQPGRSALAHRQIGGPQGVPVILLQRVKDFNLTETAKGIALRPCWRLPTPRRCSERSRFCVRQAQPDWQRDVLANSGVNSDPISSVVAISSYRNSCLRSLIIFLAKNQKRTCGNHRKSCSDSSSVNADNLHYVK